MPALQAAGVKILGTSPDSIDLAEDRFRFGRLLDRLNIPVPEWGTARSLDEATAVLAGEGPEARVVAGGTDLWPNMKRRHQRARTVVSLMALPELRGIAAELQVYLDAMTAIDEALAKKEDELLEV